MSERQFRRYRERYEEEGLDGLVDRRLGKASPKRVPGDETGPDAGAVPERLPGLEREAFPRAPACAITVSAGATRGSKTHLHRAGLVERARRRGAHRRKRERKPCEGMMLHQDGVARAWLAGQPTLDLIVTMDDATSTIYSAFLVEEEGTASTLRALLEVLRRRACRQASTPTAAAIISSPRRPARRSIRST